MESREARDGLGHLVESWPGLWAPGSADAAVEIVSPGDQVLLKKGSHSLAQMMARVTPDNLHHEFDTDPPVGNEAR